MSETTTIIADGVTYYHENDEATFFGWLDRMEVVSDYEGRGTALLIHLARIPTDDDLWELLAFHRRYEIDMRHLAAFQTAANAEWFCAPDAYWHQAVFRHCHDRPFVVAPSKSVIACKPPLGQFNNHER